MEDYDNKVKAASEALVSSKIIVITAGAGMGVDSGLPDFRGDKGFWNAYPMYEKLGINFVDAANPDHFYRDPKFAWGFYGHRLNLYRDISPHNGFNLIKKWIEVLNINYFIVTSNVDGHFQKAGFFDKNIYEIHGSIHYLQCLKPCCDIVWKNNEHIHINKKHMQAKNIPFCPYCNGIARPNILMFGDYSWVPDISHKQSLRFNAFLERYKGEKISVIEIGAGIDVPSIRYISEKIENIADTTIIRINPRYPHIAPPHISIEGYGLKVITDIDHHLFN